jgi:hypothetical protein
MTKREADVVEQIVYDTEVRKVTSQFFRVVRHTYNDNGLLAERAVLSGQHQNRDEAVLAAKSEAEKNSPWAFDQANNQWRITDKHGKAHVL